MAPVSAARRWSAPVLPASSRSSWRQAGKAVLHAETGASAVDMESHIAAAYATEAGLPFAALRVISDPATRALPAIARNAIKPNGNIDLKKVLRGLARNPFTLRALVSTGIDFNRALRILARVPRLSVRRRGSCSGGYRQRRRSQDSGGQAIESRTGSSSRREAFPVCERMCHNPPL